MYDPDTRTQRREVVTTPRPAGPNYGGALIAIVLVVLVVLGAVWLSSSDGTDTTSDTTSPTETTSPVETTIPTETTVPTTTTP